MVSTPTPKGKEKAKSFSPLVSLPCRGLSSDTDTASSSDSEFIIPDLVVPSTGLLAPRAGRAFIDGMQAIVDELSAQRKASEAHYKTLEQYLVLVGSALGVRKDKWDLAAERIAEEDRESDDEEEEGEGKKEPEVGK
jgi:hypothetical protein